MKRAGLRQQKLITKRLLQLLESKGARSCAGERRVWESLWAGCYFCVSAHHLSGVPQPSPCSLPDCTAGKLWKPSSNKLPGSHMKANRRIAPPTTTAPFTSPFLKRAWAHYNRRREKTQDNKNNKVAFIHRQMMQLHVGRAAVTRSFTFGRRVWDRTGLLAVNMTPPRREQHWPSGENRVYHHFKVNRKPQWSVYVPTLTVNYSLVHIIPNKKIVVFVIKNFLQLWNYFLFWRCCLGGNPKNLNDHPETL